MAGSDLTIRPDGDQTRGVSEMAERYGLALPSATLALMSGEEGRSCSGAGLVDAATGWRPSRQFRRCGLLA